LWWAAGVVGPRAADERVARMVIEAAGRPA
jgi:hypothetical protein